MLDPGLRDQVHRAIDAVDRPAPSLLSHAMVAVRSEPVERGQGWGRIATAAAVLVAACLVFLLLNHPQPQPSPASHRPALVQPGSAAWPEDLELSGAVEAHVTSTLPRQGANISTCTGRLSQKAGFNMDLFLADVPRPLRLDVHAEEGYHGPGTYTSGISVEQEDARDQWLGRGSLVINPDEESGSIDAVLAPYGNNTQPVHVVGRWTCKTST